MIWRTFMPYCILNLPSGNWIFLNRRYKPIGCKSNDLIDYEKSETVFKFKKTPKKILESIAVNIYKNKNGVHYFLFDDSCVPYSDKKSTKNYYSKIEKIMNFKIVE